MDVKQLNDEGRSLWDQKAEFWDALYGEAGNRFHRELVSPAVERLLALQPGERVLDVACGNGAMARKIAALGGKVTAVDFSAALIERARGRGQERGEPITYGVVDATDEKALVALGTGTFDAVVCTMALMDMPVIAPFYRAARQLLRPGGRVVVATAHPAFNSNNPVFFAEQEDRSGELIIRQGVKIEGYLEVPPTKAAGAPNEPNPHYYYHRPLHVLLGEAFVAGFVLDALEEPSLRPQESAPARMLSWASLPQIPPVFAVRFRPQSV